MTHARPSRPLDRDALFMLDREVAATVALLAVDRIQQEEPEAMVAGAAVAFAAICQRCGIDPQEAHGLGMKVLRHQSFHRKPNSQLESLRDFAGLRIMGDANVSIS